MTFEDIKALRAACLEHAQELLTASRRLEPDYPHLAYHLATLALEEIGKSEAAVVQVVPGEAEGAARFFEKMRDDHVAKLFWVLWGPTFGREPITREQLEDYQGFAARTHEWRLAGLYVDWVDERLSIPKQRISADRARTFIALAEARLGLAQTMEPAEPTESVRELFRWFSASSRDPERAGIIFGRKSLDKIQELGGDGRAWIAWLKEQFDEGERVSRELLAKELERPEPSEQERADPKWRIHLRLLTASHSIRQQDLNWWNSVVKLITLNRGRDHQELVVDLVLPKAVPLEAVWFSGWGYSRRFVLALNIATLGFFWWQVPKDVSRYFDRIEDLETRCEVRADREPRLLFDWGRNVLDQQALSRTSAVFRLLPGPWADEAAQEPFGHYLTGLAFLGKSDIHLQLEQEAFLHFFLALKTALKLYRDWDGNEAFVVAGTHALTGILRRTESAQELMELGEALEMRRALPKAITLSEVGGVKRACDGYLLSVFRRLAEAEVAGRDDEQQAEQKEAAGD